VPNLPGIDVTVDPSIVIAPTTNTEVASNLGINNLVAIQAGNSGTASIYSSQGIGAGIGQKAFGRKM